MYVPANPYSYYPDIDMVLFAMRPFGQVNYFLVPRAVLREDKFAIDKIIKWQVGSSAGETKAHDLPRFE